jgi:hypothetical protein
MTTEKVSYARLDEDGKRAFARRLVLRRKLYAQCLKGQLGGSRRILLVGDRPGPGAPADDGYHHTPFYSTKHCSGWLNAALEVEGIPEDRLVWINSADRHGNPTDFGIVEKLMLVDTIALGGNAEKWLKANGYERYTKIHHPQYWKRFHNSERYPLLDVLKKLTAK